MLNERSINCIVFHQKENVCQKDTYKLTSIISLNVKPKLYFCDKNLL